MIYETKPTDRIADLRKRIPTDKQLRPMEQVMKRTGRQLQAFVTNCSVHPYIAYRDEDLFREDS